MNMLEKAARALCEKMHGQLIWADLPSSRKAVWIEGTRAALAAIRDEDGITDEMLEAGRVALHAPENRHGAVLGAVFCAMIDAILKGESNAD